MIAKTLYVKGGTYTLTSIKADYTMTRLVADDGKALTDGKVTVDCIDIPTADVVKWTEVDAPPEPLDPVDELPLVKAELAEYKAAQAVNEVIIQELEGLI